MPEKKETFDGCEKKLDKALWEMRKQFFAVGEIALGKSGTFSPEEIASGNAAFLQISNQTFAYWTEAMRKETRPQTQNS